MTNSERAGLGPASAAADPAVGRLPSAPAGRRKRPEDTPEGCRSFAADDRDRAATFTVDQARSRYERSAAAWTARADLLDRLEAKFQARAAKISA